MLFKDKQTPINSSTCHTGQEGLSEEESGNPEYNRWSGVIPLLEEFESIQQIFDVAS